MNDLAQLQPAFNGDNTLLAVSTNIETEQITNGNLKLKGNGSFQVSSSSCFQKKVSKNSSPSKFKIDSFVTLCFIRSIPLHTGSE
jgi:hypothetical protein